MNISNKVWCQCGVLATGALLVSPQLIYAVMRMAWGRLTQPRDEAFNCEIIVFHFLGLIQGLYRAR